MSTKQPVLFYSTGVSNDDLVTDPKYSPFSNFHKLPVKYGGITWPTTEAAYQGQKFNYGGNDPDAIHEYLTLMSVADTPNKVFILGNGKIQHAHGKAWRVNKSSDIALNQAIVTYTDVDIDPKWRQADTLKGYRIEGRKWFQTKYGKPLKPLTIDPNWTTRRIDEMLAINRVKFQNSRMRELLLSTGNREIREHTRRDRVWADGGPEGGGSNLLGQVLMYIRSELQGHHPQPVDPKHRASDLTKRPTQASERLTELEDGVIAQLRKLKSSTLELVVQNPTDPTKYKPGTQARLDAIFSGYGGDRMLLIARVYSEMATLSKLVDKFSREQLELILANPKNPESWGPGVREQLFDICRDHRASRRLLVEQALAKHRISVGLQDIGPEALACIRASPTRRELWGTCIGKWLDELFRDYLFDPWEGGMLPP